MERMENLAEDSLLHPKKQPCPFPMDVFKHVEKPTTVITDSVQRIDMRDTAYGLAARGEYGPVVQKGVQKILLVLPHRHRKAK